MDFNKILETIDFRKTDKDINAVEVSLGDGDKVSVTNWEELFETLNLDVINYQEVEVIGYSNRVVQYLIQIQVGSTVCSINDLYKSLLKCSKQEIYNVLRNTFNILKPKFDENFVVINNFNKEKIQRGDVE